MLGKFSLRRFSTDLSALNAKSIRHLQVDIDSLALKIDNNRAMAGNTKFYRNMCAPLFDISKIA